MEINKDVKRLSKAAIDERIARLDDLKNVRRLEVAQEIKEARAFGDISENAEYDAAMDKQARIEYEIVMLEEELIHVEEIDESSIDFSVVNVGARVTIQELEANTTQIYDIVSTSESEPFGKKIKIECNDNPENLKNGYKIGEIIELELPPKLSNESAIGEYVIGHKKGEIITITHKKITKKYKIEKIDRIQERPRGRILQEELIF